MSVHARTLVALVVDQRSRDVSFTKGSQRSIVPCFARVLPSVTVTDEMLRDVGAEIENRPTSGLGGLSDDGRQKEQSFGVHSE